MSTLCGLSGWRSEIVYIYTLEDVIQPYKKYPKIIQNAILLAHTHPAFLGLTKSTRKVMYALLTRTSQYNGTHPIKARIDRLALEAAVSEKTVQRSIAFFREIGWLQQTEQRSQYGLFSSRLYRFSPCLCELVRLPLKPGSEVLPQQTKMSDGAVYVDLTFKEDQREISVKQLKGKPVDLPDALQSASDAFAIQPTGIAKLRGIAHAAGHKLEHIIAVARQYLQRAGVTGSRAYRYLERMASKPIQLVDYAARALQNERMIASQAQANEIQILANRCRNKRFVGPAGLVVRVFENTAEIVQGGVFTSLSFADLPRIYALVQAGTLREVEPGMQAESANAKMSMSRQDVDHSSSLPPAAPSLRGYISTSGQLAEVTSNTKAHLARIRSLVGLGKKEAVNARYASPP